MSAVLANQAPDDVRAAVLRPILRKMMALFQDLEACAVISADGLTMASVLGDDTDPQRFGAMCASLLALAESAAEEVDRGGLRQVLLDGRKGTMLLIQAGPGSVLAMASKPSINLGMLFLEARRTAGKIEGTLLNLHGQINA